MQKNRSTFIDKISPRTLCISSIRKRATNLSLYGPPSNRRDFIGRNDAFDCFHWRPTVVRIAYDYCAVYVSRHVLRVCSETNLCATSAFRNAATFDLPSIGAPPTFSIVFTSPVRTQMCENRLVGNASTDVRSCIGFHFTFWFIFVRYGFRSISGYVFKILIFRFKFLKATIERFSRR